MLFAEKIKSLREERKLLQRELAAALDIDVPMYSRIERGERPIKREQIKLIADILEYDERELLKLWLADQVSAVLDGDNEIINDVLDIAKSDMNKNKPCNNSKMIGIFSFFAGAGFLDLGFEMTNHFRTLYVNEFKESFNYIYRYSRKNMGIDSPRFGHHVGDVAEWLEDCEKNALLHDYIQQARNMEDIDLVGFIGGPPCPDFSVAGKNKGSEGDNGKLSQTYINLICNALPDFFVFENVKGLYRTAKHRAFFERIKTQLINAGYVLTEQLINAIEFGAPQDRDRIILIGFHVNLINRIGIESKDNIITNFDWERNKVYSRDVFNLNWPKTSPYKENSKTTPPKGIIEALTIEYWWKQNKVTKHLNNDMYFKPRAGLYRFQTKDEGDDVKKCYKRLHRWRYSPTAAYGNNEVHIHPYKPRRISVAEALAIQSLPAEYIVPVDVTLSDAFKVIGNGVPYLAAKGIALNIFDYIYNR